MACAGRSARLSEISATSEQRGWEPRADTASAPQSKGNLGRTVLVGQAHGLRRAVRPALRQSSKIRRARLGAARRRRVCSTKAKATWGGQFLVGQAHGLLRALRPALRNFSNIRTAWLGAARRRRVCPTKNEGNSGTKHSFARRGNAQTSCPRHARYRPHRSRHSNTRSIVSG